jgi:hypothetical protein
MAERRALDAEEIAGLTAVRALNLAGRLMDGSVRRGSNKRAGSLR